MAKKDNYQFSFSDINPDFEGENAKKKRTKKILKEIEVPDHLCCLLRNLYVGQEATVRTGDGTTD